MEARGTGGMPAGEVLAVISWLDVNGITYQVNGGWAVDALVGRQTREHRDLDVFLDADWLAATVAWLTARGYRIDVDWLPVRLELTHEALRVDLHPMRLDDHGNGLQSGLDGQLFHHPAAARTVGLIDGHPVIVADAGRLRELRHGYPPRPEDTHDLLLLDDIR